MPEIARFLGIVIGIFPREHPPAHFHAVYGEHAITVEIEGVRAVQDTVMPWSASISSLTVKPRLVRAYEEVLGGDEAHVSRDKGPRVQDHEIPGDNLCRWDLRLFPVTHDIDGRSDHGLELLHRASRALFPGGMTAPR